MAAFNRVLIILLALVVLMTASAVLLTTLGVIQPTQVAPAGAWFVDRLMPFSQLGHTTWRRTVVISLALIVLALLLLLVGLREGTRAARRLTLKDDALGRVTVTLDGVRRLANREASRVAGVTGARSQVKKEAPGLRISCRVYVDTARSVPDMTQELRKRLKAAVEHHVGLAVTRVCVDAQEAPRATAPRHRRVE